MNSLSQFLDSLNLFPQEHRIYALALFVLLVAVSATVYFLRYHVAWDKNIVPPNAEVREAAKEEKFYESWGIVGKMRLNLEKQRRKYDYAIRRTTWRAAHSHLVFLRNKAQVKINWYFIGFHYLATGSMAFLTIAGFFFLIAGWWVANDSMLFYEACATAFVNAIAITIMYLPFGQSYWAACRLRKYINE